ncbi:MAG: endonuclease MutS2 [Paludibacter sp.]|nr:endonuclease MutS2 [Bacteroidales bacterium]MCM1068974.1 endonuclease MutS2 [Prevotella sp.]MCM1353637.1 endonuclease MutS2 [Bacteroides sp.]MCM1442014.1 endonuclease MutS2 [Muribaculum sp.]MCM1481530.1 endonuclease MutS2 [Paludibacter sp.]
MIYPEEFEHKIDFQVIRDYLLRGCSFQLGREQVDALSFHTRTDEVRHLIAETQEMLYVLTDASLAFPQCEMFDLRDSLSRIRIEGLFLDEQELFRLRKALSAVVQLSQFFASLDVQRFPVLSEYRLQNGFAEIVALVPAIDRLLDKYGQLRDNASPELGRIRQELQRSQGAVSRALNTILRQAQAEGMIDKDVSPTLREGRLVIPVPPMYKRKLGGIVHDESATGKTVYIEPQQVVEANNRIRELEGDERRERIRILLEFTNTLRPIVPAITDSQYFLGKVDFLCAKALFAKELDAIAPHLSDAPVVDWREARHPVLLLNFRKQQKTVVPLSVRLTEEQRILVISGPNAGGKSVCLKTVALLQYMLQCGLLVPLREDSLMGCFEHIFIDIGDEQSIEDDLSTYSSHLRNMKWFVRHGNERTLLLIDEFGGGTEPQIGGAIAEAVLERLNANRSLGVITTHYSNLKHLAEDTEGIVNGAMLYDRGKMCPLFQLSIGQPGSSFAVEIARNIGLPEDIIGRATQLVGEEHIDYDRHLQDIARDKRYWENKRQQIRQKEKHLEERIARYDEAMENIRQKKREVLEQAQHEATELLDKTNATIENTIRRIKESEAEKQQTQQARQELADFRRQVERTSVTKPLRKSRNHKEQHKSESVDKPQLQPILGVGTRVRVPGKEMVGEIIELNGKKALVAFGNLQSQLDVRTLEYVSARQAKQTLTHRYAANVSDELRQKKLSFSQQLDLRGMRVDEALTVLMNYIDDAVMVGTEEVRILHGTGTGALRQVVRDYLKCLSRIQAFHDAHPDQGGAGITVVEF